MKAEEELELELEPGSLRHAAATRKKKVHVGAAIMPDYLNSHNDPYSEVLNRGEARNMTYTQEFNFGVMPVTRRARVTPGTTV